MKSILTLFTYLALAPVFVAQAQNKTPDLRGTIRTTYGQPISASVKLFTATGSSPIKATSTNKKGEFAFEPLMNGTYMIEISSVSYLPIKEKIEISQPETLTKNFILQLAKNDLDEVTITNKKPVIERSGNKTVMNVENSIVATGRNALEVLAKMPGVAVNQEGIISIRGQSGVNVLINGKSTFLSPEQLATLLKSLNGNELKTITLITNPSAKYDAKGGAGIIDIKLKKDTGLGTNGNIDVGYGYGKNPKSNAGISLNHRNKHLNIFGNFANNNNKYQEDLEINRNTNDGTSSTFFHQFNRQIRSSHNNSYKAGIDYFINDKNTIGFLTSGYFNNGHDSSNGITEVGSRLTTVDSTILADNPSSNRYRNQAYNLNYRWAIDTLGQEFSADFDYAHYRSEEYTVYNNHFSDGNGNAYRLPLIFRNLTPSSIKIKAAKIDYALPLNAKTKFDFGLKGSLVSTDNDFKFENLIASEWQNDISRSNRFIYDERIIAGYANFKHDFKFTSIEIGLRAEQTHSNGNSINEDKVVKRNYLDLFPNFSVNQKLSANNEIGFSYSKRIDRPDYKSLNPFIYFVDLYTFGQGNPFLNPQYTHAFEASFNHKKELNVTLGYSITNDLIIDVLLPDDLKKTLYQTVQNLDKQLSYHLTVGYPVTVSKFWNMDHTATSNYNQVKSSNLGGIAYDRKKVNFTLNSTHNFTISPSIAAELSAEFVSAQIYGTYAIKPYYGIDLGVKQSLMNKRLNLKFALNDVLNSKKARISSALPSLNYSLNQKQESRIFRLSLNYSFGSNTIKSNLDRKTSVTDEEGRIK